MKPIDVRFLRMELEECRLLLSRLPEEGGWQAQAFRRRQIRAAEALAEQLWDYSKQLEEISDPELRLIFRLRHFEGLTWAQIAERLPAKLSAGAVRMKYNRHFQSGRGSIA